MDVEDRVSGVGKVGTLYETCKGSGDATDTDNEPHNVYPIVFDSLKCLSFVIVR